MSRRAKVRPPLALNVEKTSNKKLLAPLTASFRVSYQLTTMHAVSSSIAAVGKNAWWAPGPWSTRIGALQAPPESVERDDIHVQIVVRATMGRVGRIVGRRPRKHCRGRVDPAKPTAGPTLASTIDSGSNASPERLVLNVMSALPAREGGRPLRKSCSPIRGSQDDNLPGRSVGIRTTKRWLRMVRDIDVAISSHRIVARPGKSLCRYVTASLRPTMSRLGSRRMTFEPHAASRAESSPGRDKFDLGRDFRAQRSTAIHALSLPLLALPGTPAAAVALTCGTNKGTCQRVDLGDETRRCRSRQCNQGTSRTDDLGYRRRPTHLRSDRG